jgi:hypothetical protein
MKMVFFSQLDAGVLMFLERLYPSVRFGAVSLQQQWIRRDLLLPETAMWE